MLPKIVKYTGSLGKLTIKIPIPKIPKNINTASDREQNRQRLKTCCFSKPCLKTNVFCEPIAIIKESPVSSPDRKILIMVFIF